MDDVDALQAELHAAREEHRRLVMALDPQQRLADACEFINDVTYAVDHGLPLARLAHLMPSLHRDADDWERMAVENLTA